MGQLSNKELFIFDLDGVLYRGNSPIPSAIDFIHELHKRGKKCAFLTNNASKTKTDFAIKLQKLGIETEESEIFTSAYIAAENLQVNYPGSTIFVIGEKGLETIMHEAGFNILNQIHPEIIEAESIPSNIQADFVIVGWDRFVTYSKFRCAMMLVQKGAIFYATNADTSFPGPDAIWPGAGALVAFLETALHRPPKQIFGKPNPMGINYILTQYHCTPEKAVMIGDRLTTDILAGNRAHISTICVETGIHTRKNLSEVSEECRPTLFTPNLKDLLSEL